MFKITHAMITTTYHYATQPLVKYGRVLCIEKYYGRVAANEQEEPTDLCSVSV